MPDLGELLEMTNSRSHGKSKKGLYNNMSIDSNENHWAEKPTLIDRKKYQNPLSEQLQTLDPEFENSQLMGVPNELEPMPPAIKTLMEDSFNKGDVLLPPKVEPVHNKTLEPHLSRII